MFHLYSYALLMFTNQNSTRTIFAINPVTVENVNEKHGKVRENLYRTIAIWWKIDTLRCQ